MDMLTLDFVTVEPDWLGDSPTFPPAYQFHRTYPEVYGRIRRLAFDLVDRGWTHLGIGMLWETLRYTSMLGADPAEQVGGGYTARLNNSHRAFYARLLMEQEPRLVGVFETRTKAREGDAVITERVCTSCHARLRIDNVADTVTFTGRCVRLEKAVEMPCLFHQDNEPEAMNQLTKEQDQ